jgi:hypothetical protein
LRLRSPVAALLLLPALTSCGGAHRGSHPTRPGPGLASQRFVYSVEEASGGEAGTRTTAEIDVADPYVARIVTRSPSAMLGGTAWGASGLLVLSPDGSAHQAQQSPPGFTGGDSRLDVALPLAASLGWVRRGAVTSVNGRACTTWVSGPPLDSGSIEPASGREHTTSCVDGTGRIVSDSWSRDGRVVRTRRLVSSGPGPRLSADGLDPGRTPSPLPSGAATELVRPVDAAKLASLMGVALPVPPPGAQLDRSTATAVVGADGSAHEEGAVFSYVGESRLTVISFTRHLVGAARPLTRGRPVRLAAATGVVVPVVEGLECDLVTRAGLAVKVQTDLPLPTLTAWLEQLTLA